MMTVKQKKRELVLVVVAATVASRYGIPILITWQLVFFARCRLEVPAVGI